MKIIRSFLAVIITMSLIAGCTVIHMETATSAKTADKKINLKAASDFILELPESWKNNYVKKSSKNIKHGSYVTFYAKKCYKQAKQGWLFTIMRCKDDSYTSMPSYEFVGKWNGYNYIALFSTDIQTIGVTEDAKKQYNQLVADSYEVPFSIKPVKNKRKGKGIYNASDFSLKMPDSWTNNYIVKKSKNNGEEISYVAFYAKKCYKQTKMGYLFSIGRYTDESFHELPCYEMVGKWNGIYYVAVFPTDVQFDESTKAAMKQYQKLDKTVWEVASSIAP